MEYIVIISLAMTTDKDVYYFSSEEDAKAFVPKRGIVQRIAQITEL